ncbi:MAG: class I SAM-dependent methyltransferase [Actinobacteria bacterium]|nr:class I SAM-dependent methyltransferase [Actinomycetota bacterium]
MTDARDAVQAQYEEWVYPLPIPDMAAAIAAGEFQVGDPSLVRRKIWPRNVEPAALEILIAGCGSNQAAHFAFTNPDCHVMGIDISGASLDHETHLKQKHKLDNLELRQLPIDDVGDLEQSFDYIVSTGVLHHLPDPDRGLRSLREVLAPHGVMSVMLYGHYGRLGVYMLQEVLRLLRSRQDADGLAMVQHLLDTVPYWHPAQGYVEIAPDLGYDAGLVDTFLHPSDRAYTVPQVLQFAQDNGLAFQGWLDSVYYSLSARIPADDDIFRQRAERLDKADQWKLCELVWQSPSAHRFLLCHVDRPASDYTLDFSGDTWLEYVPSLRPPIHVIFRQLLRSHSISDEPASATGMIERSSHSVELSAFGTALLDLVDAATPIRRMLSDTSSLAANAGWTTAEHVQAARRFFEQMAEWDHLQFQIP